MRKCKPALSWLDSPGFCLSAIGGGTMTGIGIMQAADGITWGYALIAAALVITAVNFWLAPGRGKPRVRKCKRAVTPERKTWPWNGPLLSPPESGDVGDPDRKYDGGDCVPPPKTAGKDPHVS